MEINAIEEGKAPTELSHTGLEAVKVLKEKLTEEDKLSSEDIVVLESLTGPIVTTIYPLSYFTTYDSKTGVKEVLDLLNAVTSDVALESGLLVPDEDLSRDILLLNAKFRTMSRGIKTLFGANLFKDAKLEALKERKTFLVMHDDGTLRSALDLTLHQFFNSTSDVYEGLVGFDEDTIEEFKDIHAIIKDEYGDSFNQLPLLYGATVNGNLLTSQGMGTCETLTLRVVLDKVIKEKNVEAVLDDGIASLTRVHVDIVHDEFNNKHVNKILTAGQNAVSDDLSLKIIRLALALVS